MYGQRCSEGGIMPQVLYMKGRQIIRETKQCWIMLRALKRYCASGASKAHYVTEYAWPNKASFSTCALWTRFKARIKEGKSYRTCMRPDVSLKQPWPWKTLPTILTLTTLIVSSYVHWKCRHTNVQFIAMRTSSSFFISRTPMGLSMPCEITRSTVPLPTIPTLMFVMFRSFIGINTWCLLDDWLRRVIIILQQNQNSTKIFQNN